MVICYSSNTDFDTELGILLSQIPNNVKVISMLGSCRSWKNFEEHGRKRLNCLEQTVSGNMDGNDSACEDSERSKEHIEKTCCLKEYLNYH